MSVIGLQDFLSAAIARQVKPDAVRAAVSATPPPQVEETSQPLPLNTTSTISPQSLGVAAFTSTAVNLAQLGAVLQISQGGVGQVSSLLQQLQALAGQASAPNVSQETLAKIDSQFQQILGQLGKIASGTTFNGASVLDGKFSGQQLLPLGGGSGAAPKVTLPDLSLFALFGGTQPNLLTPEGAAQALKSLTAAKDAADKASADIQEAQDQVEYTSATVQSALTNIGASKAVITEEDLLGAFESLVSGFGPDVAATAQIQTGNLSPALLSLLQE